MGQIIEKIVNLQQGSTNTLLYMPGTSMKLKFRYWLHKCNFYVRNGSIEEKDLHAELRGLKLIVCDADHCRELFKYLLKFGETGLFHETILYYIGYMNAEMLNQFKLHFKTVNQLQGDVNENSFLESLHEDLVGI
jgi:hypothetical protein